MKKESKIVIIDYHLGNLFSVQQACSHFGRTAVISSDKKDLLDADYAILPGVGAFGDAMKNLHDLDLAVPIKDYIASGKPFMGICLGLQLLFSESEEFGIHKGLGIIEGVTKRFQPVTDEGNALKIPQIEWNEVYCSEEERWDASPLKSCRNGEYMYFVHSLYVIPESSSCEVSHTRYGGIRYCSAVFRQNVFACQFHPEKSGEPGLTVYKNFLDQ